MLEVSGSLWSVPAAQQQSLAQELTRSGLRRLHWDTTDGRFAAEGGFTPAEAERITAATGVQAEAHIMATDPRGRVDEWAEFCDTVIVHLEAEGWHEAIDRIARRGRLPGVAVSPRTRPEEVPADVAVLCMSVTPGEAGSVFDRGVIEKIRFLRRQSPDRRIGVDGGVTRGDVPAIERAGADWVVVGGDLIGAGGVERWSDLIGAVGPDGSGRGPRPW
ncbi:hypothetical protein [Microbacterium sp. NIBRBAC000506063]|uniref:hypothetical protein n=1 Tax=Microbacterium sp. NIBRBAC000506063 TaxID=2734618 RepID=UPI001BB5E699|nr:hypothetical protein [Microbacterium sp. NIBRBAC000506063]QTV80124.1 hypothetical protein KAE78_03365 [Microbacterium sp. NIBRBAC000506063]